MKLTQKNEWFDIDEEIKKEKERLFKKMQQATKVVQSESKLLCPVDTGRLRNSIMTGVEIDGDTVRGIIETKVEYAELVHNGTSRQQPQPFMSNALENKKEEVIQILQSK